MKELKDKRRQLRKEINQIRRLSLNEFIETVDNGLLSKISQLNTVNTSIQLLEDSNFLTNVSNK